MQVLELTLREKTRENPKKHINEYAQLLEEIGEPSEKICQIIKQDMPEIPLYIFTKILDSKFKNQPQSENGKKRHINENYVTIQNMDAFVNG